ncbi:hypothetical protein BT96DRAFT_848599 [Gymnopus androsaceus JB14]|uniref:SMP-LTD domain-containing protein n=1 Tax=Gymnopus androsaceus JB14 TaxID=1447944 RepID=A0A6A4IJ20_9AGAR|nr:hypothetical protein BT96DRAFT_848599 [Gymnopus androsaceus JB14]
MGFRTILYAYIIGGFTLVPLLLCALVAYAIYTSEPVSEGAKETATTTTKEEDSEKELLDVQDMPRTRKGWLTVRRTFEESSFDGGYVTLVRSFLDARSKDPKRSRPRDMWYVVLKGKILYLYEDEAMTECEAAIQLGSHDVVIFPEGLLDGELFTKRNAICLKPKQNVKVMPSLTREMKLDDGEEGGKPAESTQTQAAAKQEALNNEIPWFIFVRSTAEMEDWYFALIHASQHPAQTPTLDTLQDVFSPSDMNILVSTLDEQPDIIPMRWFNAIFGRIFYAFYKTQHLESFIIGRLMKKLSKVKRPTFLNDIVVTEVSVGNRTPVFSKPMLKELTKEGDASMEVHIMFKGEVRITVQATATINLGARFKPYTVKLVLAAVLRELEGNLLVKVKRPPSNRIWYAFTQMPRMVLNVEPVVSDRQITWSMILSTIESSLKTIIQESIVMPNMDDIAFFETVHRGGNRGGIWAAAARKHGEYGIQTEDQSSMPPTLEEPLLSDTQNDSINPATVPLQKSLSLQEASSSAPDPSLTPASSSTLPDSSSASNRRKTWFNSARGTDTNTSSDQYSDNDVEAESRGRTWDAPKAISVRSQSTPKAEASNDDDDNATMPTSLDTPPVKQRSTSQSSIRESDTSSRSSVSDSARARNNSDGSSLAAPASTSGTPPSPTNFLTTLKSRAGDKQALSNSAKEAMRKWGVKWGGLNKDSSGANSSSSQAQNEDMPDHDLVGEGSGLHSRSRTMSHMDGSSSSSQRARASYAEVRAKVAERRERSDHRQEPQDTRSDMTSSSTPIAIPNNSSKSQNGEFPSPPVNGSASSSSGSAPVISSSYSMNGKDLDPQIHSVSASASSSSSASSSTKSSTAADGTKFTARSHTTPALPLDETAPVHSPIHVQPQSKTMSIPGIHASHRGEVMSMGYVAPSPQGDKEKGNPRSRTSSQGSTSLGLGSLGASSLSKNPKIQSMYRLWKQASSNSNSEGQDSVSQSDNDGLVEGSSRDLSTSSTSVSSGQQDANPAQSAPVLPASMSSIKRAPPPPLPPRPSPVTISPSRPPPLPSRTPSSVSRASASHQPPAPSVSTVFSSQQPTISSAQDVLKEIATKDDHTRKRASLSLSAGSSVSGSPPSPTIGRHVSAASARSLSPAPAPSFTLDDPAAARTEDNEHSMASSMSQIDAARAWGLDDEDFTSEE